MMKVFPVFLFIFFVATSSWAQDEAFVNPYCEGAVSSADIMDCTKRYHDQSSENLAEKFQEVLESLPEEQQIAFQGIQKDWVLYRDSECAFEGGKSKAASLQRVEELSCLIRLTLQRVALLEKMMEEEETSLDSQYASTPRWMVVLMEEYSDIFWRFGAVIEGDADCDGELENLISGFIPSDEKGSSEKAVLAIVENSLTGRPYIQTIRAPISREENGGGVISLCSAAFKIAIRQNKEASCPTIIVQEKNDFCPEIHLILNEENNYGYELARPVLVRADFESSKPVPQQKPSNE